MELYLTGGTRRCCIDGTWSGEFTATGDVVEVVDGELTIVGRKDDQVKINGVRCNLSSLTELVHSIKEVFFAYFTVYKDKFLVLFVMSETAIEDSLRNVVPSSFFPSKLIYLDRVPLTMNGWFPRTTVLDYDCTIITDTGMFSGKVNRAHLIAMLEEECSMQMKSWASILAFLGKFGINSLSDLKSHSFTDYEVENANLRNLAIDVTIIPISQPNVKWACDLEKCIDGDPVLTTLRSTVVSKPHLEIVENTLWLVDMMEAYTFCWHLQVQLNGVLHVAM
ncbi:hypothetical protein ANCDUO_09810 [Ancylostoma duodenale]|uniref:Uncharacterized protein n=1 Tax=Ancylostoma duodenale TaxID=51022 RepID=A0A0C2GSC4_9BILA|nr:hypothetical protein ANCDUO_09810 [Ancylostoma duodenale]